MNGLDWLLVVSLVLAAISGWRSGLIVGLLGFVGLVAGGAVGLAVAPRIVDHVKDDVGRTAAAVGVVLVAAALGQALLAALGRLLRGLLRWTPLRAVDSGLGALLSLAGASLAVWFLAATLRTGPVPAIADEVRGSRVVAAIDQVVPAQARALPERLLGVLVRGSFPQVFRGVVEPVLPVPPPDPAVAGTPGVERAAASVVEVRGLARSCSRQIEGSGFVVAPGRVVTNAHVVAGVASPVVQVGGRGRAYSASVVLFDPATDVAVLRVDRLAAPPLVLDARRTAIRGDAAVVAGFPLGGPYRLGAARVQQRITARGADIYGGRDVARDVYALKATVRPGNSGGPLLAPDGSVLGVVFAQSVEHPDVGYALTARQVRADVDRGVAAAVAVGTGRCA